MILLILRDLKRHTPRDAKLKNTFSQDLAHEFSQDLAHEFENPLNLEVFLEVQVFTTFNYKTLRIQIRV